MATFTKLKNGDWGIKTEGIPNVGEKVSVTKKNGETKVVEVTKVVWSGEEVSICEIAAQIEKKSGGKVEECAECGMKRRGCKMLPDSSGIVAPVCPKCASQTTQFERSYC